MDKGSNFFRGAIKQLLTFPISPPMLRLLVAVLRGAGIFRKPKYRNSDRIEKIFISHPYSSIGDAVLLLPLLERIRMIWPDASVDIAIGATACDLLAGVEGLNQIFVCGSHRTKLWLLGSYQRFFRYLRLYKRQVMLYDYDLAIVPRWGRIEAWAAAYLAYLTGARMRIGYSASVDGGDSRLDALLTVAVAGGDHEHETARNLKLLMRAGIAEEGIEEESAVDHPIRSLVRLAQISHTLEGDNLLSKVWDWTGKRYAVLSPGATNAFRLWPLEFLVEVVQTLHNKAGLITYIVGGGSDSRLCNQLAGNMRACAISLAGRTSVEQLVALLARAKLFVGMDSGTAHIAGALGIPTVVVSPFPSSIRADHPNSPVRFKPCGPRVRVLQPLYPLAPCWPTCSFPGPHCSRQVTPTMVVEAAAELLGAMTTSPKGSSVQG